MAEVLPNGLAGQTFAAECVQEVVTDLVSLPGQRSEPGQRVQLSGAGLSDEPARSQGEAY